MAITFPSLDNETEHPELSPDASPSMPNPFCSQSDPLHVYTCTAIEPFDNGPPPMAITFPSLDNEIEDPNASPTASPLMSTPFCNHVNTLGLKETEGLEDGFKDGWDDGLEDSDGFNDGWDDGLEDSDGFNDGWDDGLVDSDGFKDGWDDGLDDTDGVNDGWKDGMSDTDGSIDGSKDGLEETDGSIDGSKDGLID